MSYFDGIIPKTCAACFYKKAGKWEQIDPGQCDECDYMLEMFPLLDDNSHLDLEKLDLLKILDAPDWKFTKQD